MSSFRKLSYAVVLAGCCSAQTTSAVPYVAKLLVPSGNVMSGLALGISEGTQVGFGPSGNYNHALLWNGSAASMIDLHPVGLNSSDAFDVSGNTQIGSGAGPTTGNSNHALLWHGSSASVVDLNPSGFKESHGWATTLTNQVGYGVPSGAASTDNHALLWSGTAASAVDLHPAGFVRTWAYGVYGASQVGEGLGPATGGIAHALMWHGAPDSIIDLNPNWGPNTGSSAMANFNNFQVGWAGANGTHATLWNGSSASAIDLNPAGFITSEADGLNENYQVGGGRLSDPSGDLHALLWNGSAASAVDLHQYLVGLPVTLKWSAAWRISSDGAIVGWGYDSGFTPYPILWTPVPEPSSLILCSLAGLASLGLIQRPKK